MHHFLTSSLPPAKNSPKKYLHAIYEAESKIFLLFEVKMRGHKIQ